MASLLRLTVAALLLLFAGVSFAAPNKVMMWDPSYNQPFQSTPDKACSVRVSFLNSSSPNADRKLTGPATLIAENKATCPGQTCSFSDPPRCESSLYTVNGYLRCPANSSEIGGTCVCASGTKEIDGQCVLPTEEDKLNCWNFSQTGTLPGGDLTVEYRYSGNIANGSKFCVPVEGMSSPSKGCTVTFNRESYFDYGGNRVTEGTLSMAADANTVDQSCSLNDGQTPPKQPPEEKCPAGFTGTVNGVEVCVDKVPDSGVEPGSDETTNDDGQNTTTTRTNSETKCENGRCTTTTTTTTTVTNNATGASTSTGTNTSTTQSQESFCKANPKAKLCGGTGLPNVDGGGSGGGGGGEEDPSSFTGACAGGFQCKGDAIQCAIAREQHIRACRLFDKESAESKLYDQFKGKEGNQTTDNPNNEAISLAGKIDTSDAIGGGGCIGDLSVTVWGQSLSLPLSNLCQYLAMLGNVLVAVSMLMATRIVTRG